VTPEEAWARAAKVRELRLATGRLPYQARQALIYEDQQNTMRHCLKRLADRYGVAEEQVARELVWMHHDQVRRDPNRRRFEMYSQPGERRVYALETAGRIYYPLMRPGDLSGRHIIVTYLSSEMVLGRMLGLPREPCENGGDDSDE
jgi:hypothetical protein